MKTPRSVNCAIAVRARSRQVPPPGQRSRVLTKTTPQRQLTQPMTQTRCSSTTQRRRIQRIRLRRMPKIVNPAGLRRGQWKCRVTRQQPRPANNRLPARQATSSRTSQNRRRPVKTDDEDDGEAEFVRFRDSCEAQGVRPFGGAPQVNVPRSLDSRWVKRGSDLRNNRRSALRSLTAIRFRATRDRNHFDDWPCELRL